MNTVHAIEHTCFEGLNKQEQILGQIVDTTVNISGNERFQENMHINTQNFTQVTLRSIHG